MMQFIRKQTGGWIVKGLLLLLIASFAVWGIGDFGSGSPLDDEVASVGGEQINRYDVERQVRLEMQRLNARFGGQLTTDMAAGLGIPQAVLGQMISEALMAREAYDLGLAVSDEQVRQDILDNPAFRTQLGAGGFDRMRFETVLAQNGLTEQQYVQTAKNELAREQLLQTLERGFQTPDVLAETLYRHREEARVATSVFVPDAVIETPLDPGDDRLRAHYDANKAIFNAPEYRGVTLVLMRAEDLVDPESVTEEEIQAEYDTRAQQFAQAERRDVQQMIVPDQATAVAARDRVRGGEDFAAVAQELAGMGADAVNIGLVDRGGLLSEVADAVFQLETGAVSDPIAGPGGAIWYIAKVNAIEAETQQDLDAVRDEVARAAAEGKAINALYDLANAFEDEIGKGASITEAADRTDLTPIVIDAVDQAGQTPAGTWPDGLPTNGAPILQTIFQAEEGIETSLNELGPEAFYMVRVENIQPVAPRTFEAARADVLAHWQVGERARQAEIAATVAQDMLKQGRTGTAAAEDVQGQGEVTQPFKRYHNLQTAGLPVPVVARAFELGLGETAVVAVDGGSFAIRIDEVTPADPSQASETRTALAGQLAATLQTDVITQVAAALRTKHGVEVNEAAFQRLFEPIDAGGHGGAY